MPTIFSDCDECNNLSYLPDKILNTIPNYTYRTHLEIFNLLRSINVKGVYIPDEICIKIIKYSLDTIKCQNCVNIFRRNKGMNITLLCKVHLKIAMENCKIYDGKYKMMCRNCCWNEY